MRETDVQQPNVAATLSFVMSSRAFSAKRGPIRGWVHHHGLELLAEKAALLVLLVDEHEHGVFERRLRNRHGAGERMEDAYLDRLLSRGDMSAAERGGECENGAEHRPTIEVHSAVPLLIHLARVPAGSLQATGQSP